MAKKKISKTAMIIIPHVDDELYSCWSILCDKSYDKIVIVRCTTNDSQESRLKIYDRLLNDPKFEGFINKNVVIKNICSNLFSDGRLSHECVESSMVTMLDKLFTKEWVTDLFIPAKSHHQDHEYLNKCCLAALRVRSTLKVKNIFEYIYVYHTDADHGSVYHPMTKQDLNNLLITLETIDLEYSNIFDLNSVNSPKIIKSDLIRNGKMINKYAADRFIPLRVTHE